MRRHLGPLAAAYVDGELSAAEHQRVVAHLARCPRCRDEVAAQRDAKRRLRRLGPPGVPGDLALRLAAGPDALPLPRLSFAEPGGRPAANGAGTARQRVTLAAAAVAAVTAGLVGGAVAVGGQPGSGPTVTPPVGSLLVEHAATTGEVPLVDPALTAVTVSAVRAATP